MLCPFLNPCQIITPLVEIAIWLSNPNPSPTPNPKPTNKPMNINILETSDDKEPLKLYHL